jgi:hypothetical protein
MTNRASSTDRSTRLTTPARVSAVAAIPPSVAAASVLAGRVISPRYALESLDSLMDSDGAPDSPGIETGPSERQLRATTFATMAGAAVITFVIAAILVFATVHNLYQYFA